MVEFGEEKRTTNLIVAHDFDHDSGRKLFTRARACRVLPELDEEGTVVRAGGNVAASYSMP